MFLTSDRYKLNTKLILFRIIYVCENLLSLCINILISIAQQRNAIERICAANLYCVYVAVNCLCIVAVARIQSNSEYIRFVAAQCCGFFLQHIRFHKHIIEILATSRHWSPCLFGTKFRFFQLIDRNTELRWHFSIIPIFIVIFVIYCSVHETITPANHTRIQWKVINLRCA